MPHVPIIRGSSSQECTQVAGKSVDRDNIATSESEGETRRIEDALRITPRLQIIYRVRKENSTDIYVRVRLCVCVYYHRKKSIGIRANLRKCTRLIGSDTDDVDFKEIGNPIHPARLFIYNRRLPHMNREMQPRRDDYIQGVKFIPFLLKKRQQPELLSAMFKEERLILITGLKSSQCPISIIGESVVAMKFERVSGTYSRNNQNRV